MSLSQEIELYDFISNSAQFHLTPHEFDVDLGGTLYTSLPIERSELVLGAEAAKSALELRVPPDVDLVRHLLNISVTGEVTSVTLRVAKQDEQSGQWSIWGTRWMGRVMGVEVVDDHASLRCESVRVSLKRIGLRRPYSRTCPYVLYSVECGASPISANAIVAQAAGRNVYFSASLPAGVAGGLAGGWLETPNGTRYMIVEELGGDDLPPTYGSGVKLLYPAAIATGTVVLLVAGCDHSIATCKFRFGNLNNYGGFPHIPLKNPFSTGVF